MSFHHTVGNTWEIGIGIKLEEKAALTTVEQGWRKWFGLSPRGASSPLAGGQYQPHWAAPGEWSGMYTVYGEPEDWAVHTCPFLLQTSAAQRVYFLLPSRGVSKESAGPELITENPSTWTQKAGINAHLTHWKMGGWVEGIALNSFSFTFLLNFSLN